MPNTRVRDAAARAANLTPFDAGSIRGDYAAVCSPVSSIPRALQSAHVERHDTYMATGARMSPGNGPRYFITSGGTLIAWVTLDGHTHYAKHLTPLEYKHQAMIRAAWPVRFTLTSD
jgi:hypothetical protein